jgi:single-strand DNA-binding protein
MKSNRVLLIGYVGKDLATVKMVNGAKRIGIRMATHSQYKNEKGEKINTTVWHDVVAWNREAEYAERSFVKGSKMLVEGAIVYRTYPDATGHTRYITEIKADSLMNLDR